ncbi:HAMP domain-containing sensor histidine kinase [uncultured Roseobacter sp.]|uniref:sensor histidine kinase n=1 Tax=uncultured Roseobacter sp. TaxID=114847 RepID=UPI00261DEC36|nr:HAMP domain-containing sensor histidine kinase [uncultured Roseobacter sp.]
MAVAPVSDPVDQEVPASADSPEFLRRMVSLVPGILYIFNHRTQSNEYSNRSIAELLGYTREETIALGDRLMETIIHPEEAARVDLYLEKLANCKDGIQRLIEYRAINRQGSIVWLRSIDAVFDRDAEGRVLRHIGIAMDITAQKKAAERLKAKNHELEQLTYVATHDLRGPVTNMTSLVADLMTCQEMLPPAQAESLDLMQEVTDQARKKLDTLVLAAEASSGELPAVETVSLVVACETAMSRLRDRISWSGARVRTSFEATQVRCMPEAPAGILEALICNALDYCPADRTPDILISSRSEDAVTVLEVRDNGAGLDPERDCEKVFSLFQRAHAEPAGEGVSLYVAKCLIERIGGRIGLSVAPDGGAVFKITFPN